MGNLDIKGGEAWWPRVPFGPKFLEATLKDSVPEADPIGWEKFRLFLEIGKPMPMSSVMNLAALPEAILTERPYPG